MRSAATALLVLALALPPAAAPAGDRATPEARPAEVGEGHPANRVTVEQQEAIDRGLRWLAAQQDAGGGFPARPADGLHKSADYQTAVTALCTLAFLGAGHGLERGPHREVVRKGVGWLLRAQESHPDGFIAFGGDDQSKMHGHGYATLALAEAFATAGSTGEPESGTRNADAQTLRDLTVRLRKGIQAAVKCIEDAQCSLGGWGYSQNPIDASDHEGSVTVCQVQALLSASNRGFTVSLERIQAARMYMKKSQTRAGGFRYRLTEEEDRDNPRTYSWALASAGVVSLLGLAEYDRKDAIDRGIGFMERKARMESPDPRETPYYFYGSFYAVQAYHWVGGERWERYWIRMRRWLLENQGSGAPAGAWSGKDTQVDLGPAYPTALCLLMLEVPVGYLSIFAR